MGITGYFQDLTDQPKWRTLSLSANALDRVPRSLQYLTLGLAALHTRCPLLCRRLSTRRVVIWCSCCRQVACPLMCLRDYCESIGGKWFHKPDRFDNLSDGCSLVNSVIEPWLLAQDLNWICLGKASSLLGWLAFWGSFGESLCALLAKANRGCRGRDPNLSVAEWSCLGLAKGCETAFRLLEESEVSLPVKASLGFCSGLLSMYRAYKE